MFEDRSSNSNEGILRRESCLTADHIPEKPSRRETEIDRLADALRPLARRKSSPCLYVFGPAGVGKTTCVNYVLDHIEDETPVKQVRINCWKYNTRSSFLTELLVQLGYPAPRKGKPVDELLAKLREWLDKNRSVAVGLDEFDQLQDKAEVAYDLDMLSQQTENELGLVMVSNLPPEALTLDERSWSRLRYQTLSFEPYTAEQLRAILEERVEQAFKPGAVEDDVIDAIAENVAAEDGDCRQAFDRLLQAGRHATQHGAQTVTTGDIVTADG